jgi:hypothetical protein
MFLKNDAFFPVVRVHILVDFSVACPAKLHEPPDKQAPNSGPACAEVVQLVLTTTTDLRRISVAAKNTTREPVFALTDPLQTRVPSNKQFHCSPLPLYNACPRLLPKLWQPSISYCYARYTDIRHASNVALKTSCIICRAYTSVLCSRRPWSRVLNQILLIRSFQDQVSLFSDHLRNTQFLILMLDRWHCVSSQLENSRL